MTDSCLQEKTVHEVEVLDKSPYKAKRGVFDTSEFYRKE